MCTFQGEEEGISKEGNKLPKYEAMKQYTLWELWKVSLAAFWGLDGMQMMNN